MNSWVISASTAYSITPGFRKRHTRSKALPVMAMARRICSTSSAVFRLRTRCMIGALRRTSCRGNCRRTAAFMRSVRVSTSLLWRRCSLLFRYSMAAWGTSRFSVAS